MVKALRIVFDAYVNDIILHGRFLLDGPLALGSKVCSTALLCLERILVFEAETGWSNCILLQCFVRVDSRYTAETSVQCLSSASVSRFALCNPFGPIHIITELLERGWGAICVRSPCTVSSWWQ